MNIVILVSVTATMLQRSHNKDHEGGKYEQIYGDGA